MVNTMCGSAWQALWHFFLCCVFARCATSEHHQFPPAAVICVVARHAVNTLHEFPWQSWEILRVSLVWFKLYGKQRRRKNCSANLSFFPFFFFLHIFQLDWAAREQNNTAPRAFMARRTDCISILDIKFPWIVQHFAQTTNNGRLATVKQSPICWAMHDSSHVATYKYWCGVCKTTHTSMHGDYSNIHGW